MLLGQQASKAPPCKACTATDLVARVPANLLTYCADLLRAAQYSGPISASFSRVSRPSTPQSPLSELCLRPLAQSNFEAPPNRTNHDGGSVACRSCSLSLGIRSCQAACTVRLLLYTCLAHRVFNASRVTASTAAEQVFVVLANAGIGLGPTKSSSVR
jgi:hypothetical protein